VKRVLAHIYSDGGYCVNHGRARHRGAPSPDKAPAYSESSWGQERGRFIPFATDRIFVADGRFRGHNGHGWSGGSVGPGRE
jgi:hypothetical protein